MVLLVPITRSFVIAAIAPTGRVWLDILRQLDRDLEAQFFVWLIAFEREIAHYFVCFKFQQYIDIGECLDAFVDA